MSSPSGEIFWLILYHFMLLILLFDMFIASFSKLLLFFSCVVVKILMCHLIIVCSCHFVDNLLPLVCVIWVAVSVLDIGHMGTAICWSSSHWDFCQ